MYDLPATVDKILALSQADQLFYVGHSQGGGIGFAQLSRDPEFAQKIKLFVPLAPAVYLGDLFGPLKLLAPFSRDLDVSLNYTEFLMKVNVSVFNDLRVFMSHHSTICQFKINNVILR